MELKEFVKETIIQITDGIRDGHKYIIDNKFGEGVSDRSYKEIYFDVAVSSEKSNKKGIGGKINVAQVFSAGGKSEKATNLSNLNRLQFQIAFHVETQKKKDVQVPPK